MQDRFLARFAADALKALILQAVMRARPYHTAGYLPLCQDGLTLTVKLTFHQTTVHLQLFLHTPYAWPWFSHSLCSPTLRHCHCMHTTSPPSFFVSHVQALIRDMAAWWPLLQNLYFEGVISIDSFTFPLAPGERQDSTSPRRVSGGMVRLDQCDLMNTSIVPFKVCHLGVT